MTSLDFSHRADLDEEMDGPCSYEELRDCLRDLAVVNRITFAHEHTLHWLERVFSFTSPGDVGRPIRMVDVGCGYGDMLRHIEGWAAQRGIAMELVGLDINANAIRAAREATPATSRIRWVQGNALTAAEAQAADLIASCGVLHHLPEAEIVRLLAWMDRTARIGWYITDLHRKPVPYHFFDWTMRGPWWHRFIRTDGLRSIRRSFVEEDWQRMCSAAGLNLDVVEIAPRRPARLCVGRIGQVAAEAGADYPASAPLLAA